MLMVKGRPCKSTLENGPRDWSAFLLRVARENNDVAVRSAALHPGACGFDAALADDADRRAVDYACMHGNVSILEALMDLNAAGVGEQLGAAAAGGFLPLQLATLANREAAVRWLLRRGADPNQVHEETGAAALFMACGVGVLEALKEAGAELRRVDRWGHNALVYYAYEGWADSFHWLATREPDLLLQRAEGGSAASCPLGTVLSDRRPALRELGAWVARAAGLDRGAVEQLRPFEYADVEAALDAAYARPVAEADVTLREKLLTLQ